MSDPFAALKSNLKQLSEHDMPRATQMFLMTISDRAAEKTPVDTSNLINSRFTNVTDYLGLIEGTVGYTAEYAMAVHEMPGTLMGEPRENFGKTAAGVEFGGGTGRGNYWDPNAEPRFLELGRKKAIREDLPAIIESIKR